MTRTVAITGATDGLGRALAVRLAREDVALVLHGRSSGRLDDLVAEIGPTTTHPPRTVVADLADLAQVARAAQEIARLDALHVLVNNAGIGSGEPDGRERRTSADGHELRFAVNYLSGFLLTETLLPLLRSSATAAGQASRVVNVASLGQAPLDFDDLMLTRGYDGSRAYAQSKLAQILATVDLAERLPADEVTVNALHPGTYMPTKIVMNEIGRSTDTLDTGVESTRRLVLDPALDGVTGRFFDRLAEGRPHHQADDPAARAALRERSLALVGPYR